MSNPPGGGWVVLAVVVVGFALMVRGIVWNARNSKRPQ